MGAKGALRFQHDDLAAVHREPTRDGKPDDAGADHRAFNALCHNSCENEKARSLHRPTA